MEDIHRGTCPVTGILDTDMKTLTKSQFVDLIKSSTITQDSDVSETVYPDDDQPAMVWGWIWNKLETDGISIIYQNTYEHPEYKYSEIETSNDAPELWQIEEWNIEVVDEDGDEIDRDDLIDMILEETSIDRFYLTVFGDDDIEDIDNEDSDMETFTVQRDNDKNIRFTGELIAVTSSSDNNASGSYSGSTGRWSELNLYKTAGGKFICEQIGYTRWQGEHTRYSGAICENEEQVIEFFGTGWLAKDLYEKSGIECVENID